MGNVLGPTGVDVRNIAVTADGTRIYAVAGDSVLENVVYVSSDAGSSWTALEVSIEADLVAVAPDNANVVAIVRKSPPAAYLSTNGGLTWNSLSAIKDKNGTAANIIYDIAISALNTGAHYIAVVGKEPGDIANVWYTNTGLISPVWMETNTLDDFSSVSEMKAVAFSPNFPLDKVMVTVGESDNSSVIFEIFSLSSHKWNTSAGFAGYPVTIISNDGITDLAAASISLAPDYLGSDDTKRTGFVGLTTEGDTSAKETSGIYRLKNTNKECLKAGINIYSVAFDGTNLIAGAYDSNAVYRSSNPLAKSPSIYTASSLKRPGGENRVVVAWTGSNVVAGTSGNESAFAVSGNKGRTFNDISLIDTALTNLRDVAVSADGSKVYLVTDDGTDLSLWRNTPSWARVLSQQRTANYIVRIAPEDADVVYAAEKNAKTIYYSPDGGETEWLRHTCSIDIQDLAIESADVAYALNREGEVSKSINAGREWETAKSITPDTDTDTDTWHMIVSVSQDNLLVGSTNGYVAYSTNGNSSWNKIPKRLQNGAGNVQVTADKDFATTKTIYAASDKTRQNINRWKIGNSTHWIDIFRNVVQGGVYGLVTDGSTLYALEFNPYNNQSTLWQCLSPTAATDASSSWEARTTTTSTDATDAQVFLKATPQALKVSSDGKLWAIKTNGTNRLYNISDIMTGLILREPAAEFTNPVNPVTGTANEIAFSWERWATASEYKLYIARDENFTELVTTVTEESDESIVFLPVGPGQGGDAKFDFMPGTTYYWRVRVTQPLYNLYSETRSFTVASIGVPPLVIIKQSPAPVINMPPWPEVVIPAPEIKIPPPPPMPPPQEIVISPTPSAPDSAYSSPTWAIVAGILIIFF